MGSALQSTPVRMVLAAMACALLATYINVFRVEPGSWVSLLGGLVMLMVMGACMVLMVVFLGWALVALWKKKQRHVAEFVMILTLGFLLVDALSQLGKLDDKTPYLTTMTPILAGVFIALLWGSFTTKNELAEFAETP